MFSVSEDPYKLVNKDNSLRLKVKFLLKNSSDLDIDLYPEVILKDEDGMEIIVGRYQMGLSDYEKQKFDKFVAGELGNEVEILFTNEFNDKLFKKVLSVANKFAVTNFRLKSSKNFIVNDSVEDLDSIEDILDATNDIVNSIDDIDDEDYQDLIDDYKKTMELTKDAMDLMNNLLQY